MKSYKQLLVGASALFLLSLSTIARADDDHSNGHSNVACPVGLVSGMTLGDEFGADVAANTRRIVKRYNVRTMFGVNQLFATGSITSPYALGQIANVLNDYEVTDGMVNGKDFQIIAVVHGPGGKMLLNDDTVNPFKAQVEALMARGVTFYFCENTVRGLIRQVCFSRVMLRPASSRV